MYIVDQKKILNNYNGQTTYTRKDHPLSRKQKRNAQWEALRQSLRGTDFVDPSAFQP